MINSNIGFSNSAYSFSWKIKAIEIARRNGLTLCHELDAWTADRDVVLAAICQNPLAFRFAYPFQNNQAIARAAICANGLARFWLSTELQKDHELQELAQSTLPKEGFTVSFTDRTFTGNRCPPLKFLNAFENYSKTLAIKLEYCSSRFIRDSQLPLFSGRHLLPYPIKKPYFHSYLRATLPASATHLFFDSKNQTMINKGLCGSGFQQNNVDQAMVMAYDYSIPFTRGSTCIEGGNCFLFTVNHQKKAVIGEVSLYLSMIALEEQGIFAELSLEEIAEPTPEAFRIARNQELFNTIKKPLIEKERAEKLKAEEEMKEREPSPKNLVCYRVEEIGDDEKPVAISPEELSYFQHLLTPISENEHGLYLEKAKKIEAQLKKTKEQIAQELGLPMEGITFIPQIQFHIDLEMFVTPQGELVLHDREKALDFLAELKKNHPLSKEEEELFTAYRSEADKNLQLYKSIEKKRIEILEAHQIPVRLMPAVFAAPAKKSVLNYCNGLFVKKGRPVIVEMSGERLSGRQRLEGYHFITTGPSHNAENVFHQRFTELFSQTFPAITFQGVPEMSEFMAEYHGGVHCLTIEETLVSHE